METIGKGRNFSDIGGAVIQNCGLDLCHHHRGRTLNVGFQPSGFQHRSSLLI